MNNKLSYVDSMRGIAILMVILVHTAQQVPGLGTVVRGLAEYGQMGVQLFFVASAYTLCLSFEERSTEPRALLSFYVRRGFRIAPLYYLAILIYFSFLIAQQLLKSGHVYGTYPYSIFNILANILFLHGFVPSANNNIVLGGWSIGTEMAFYLFFPLIFSISKKIAEKKIILLFALLAFCLAVNISLQLVIRLATTYAMKNNNFLYYNFTNQLPVFIAGIVAYFLNKQERAQSFLSSPAITGTGFIVFSAISLLLWNSKISLVFAVIPTVSAVSFVLLLNFLKAAKRQNAVICKVGTVSFSMYVFHFLFVLGLAPFIIARFPSAIPPGAVLLLTFILCSVLTFYVARFTEKAIEAKGILMGSRLIARLQAQPPKKQALAA